MTISSFDLLYLKKKNETVLGNCAAKKIAVDIVGFQ